MGQQDQAVEEARIVAAVVEFSDDAIIGSTLDGVVTSWNPAAAKLYGYSCEEIVGKSGRLLAPEDRAAQMSAVLVRVRDGETVDHLETTLVRKDGTVVPVSLTLAPVRDEGGGIVGVCTFHRDVTERGRAFEVAQRMEAIIESSDDAIIALTLEGIVTSWDPAAERLFGYTTEEIIGMPAETVTPKERPDEMKDILAKVRAGEHIDHLETIRVRKDGSVFPVSLTVSAICDADGAIVGTSMISRNMTELKHAVRYARSLIEAAVDPALCDSTPNCPTLNCPTTASTVVAPSICTGSLCSHWVRRPDSLGERNRGLYVLKSRGTAHSNQIRELTLSDTGMEVLPVVIGPEGY